VDSLEVWRGRLSRYFDSDVIITKFTPKQIDFTVITKPSNYRPISVALQQLTNVKKLKTKVEQIQIKFFLV
jgi:hypothetical protein